jgi:hypothetical protein
MSRRADISAFSQRLSPSEVAELWFRRSAGWAKNIHVEHPDFPCPGPDGLYLRDAVREWFDRWHGRQPERTSDSQFEEEALRIARNGRGQNSAPSQ